MRKIVIFNQKGGVGKSTSVVNIAGCLSKNIKKKVLVVDLDGQCTTTSYLRTIEGECDKNLYHYIMNEASAEDVVYPVHFDKWSLTKRIRIPQDTLISLVPSSPNFSRNEFNENFTEIEILRHLFAEIDESRFDYCIFDCPGYISKLTESALRISDYILVPAFADLDSLNGYEQLIDTKNRMRQTEGNVGLDILGVFFTSFTGYSVNRQVNDFCKTTLGGDVFNTRIRRAASVLDARVIGKPLSYYKPSEAVSEDYLTLTKEIIKRIELKEQEKGENK